MTRPEVRHRLNPRSLTAEVTDRGEKNRRFGRREYTVHATGVYAEMVSFQRTGVTLNLLARRDWGARRKAKKALRDIVAKDAVGVVTWESEATGILGKRPREVSIYRHGEGTERSYTIESRTDRAAKRKAVRIDKKLDREGVFVGLSEKKHTKYKRRMWERPLRLVSIYQGSKNRGFGADLRDYITVEAWTNWGAERKGVRKYKTRERNRRHSP
ncbi:MAG TPA: hypothetical protein VLF20_03940 [Patescibacteria group bacterium]|nr:hypothetical protein [Patescibacteria group bacterium]